MTPTEQEAFDQMRKSLGAAIQERDAIYALMDSKRKCMEELRDALVYHMEQTRPIQRSIDALAAVNAVRKAGLIIDKHAQAGWVGNAC